MRVKTDQKRREIIEAAESLFTEHGYDRTSMAMISQRVGGSKATLYGYFRSKEELLRALLDFDVNEQAERLMGEFLSEPDLNAALKKLGIAYLMRRLSPLPVANIKHIANQPANSTLGKHFYDTVLGPAWGRLARRFEMLMDEGRLRRADPWVAAMHWKGLTEWDMLEKRLLGATNAPDPAEVERASALSAEAFLKLYGPETTGADS